MTFFEDAKNVVEFSLSWTKDKRYWKYYAIFAVLYFVLNLFDGKTFASAFTFENGSGVILPFLVMFLVIAAFVLSLYFSYKLLCEIMSSRFSKVREFNVSTFIGLLINGVLGVLAALFSAFELKWLALLAVGLVLAGGAAFLLAGQNTILAIALGVLAGIALLGYGAILLRNFVRLSLSFGLYLQGSGIVESLKSSWGKTPGKALKIFGLFLVAGIVIWAIILAELLPQLVAGIADSVISLAGIPLKPFTAILAAIFSPAIVLIEQFAYVAIYELIVGKTSTIKTKAKK